MKHIDPKADFEELEAEPIAEKWNSYELKDGSKIKARSILTKVLWPKGILLPKGEEVQIQIGGSMKTLVAVFAPPALRGTPNPAPPSPAAALRMKKHEAKIGNTMEEWSYYRVTLPEGKPLGLKVKMVVTSVIRIDDVFNEEGDPFYIVNSQTVVGPVDKGELPEKIEV